jgi:hypothetical protein
MYAVRLVGRRSRPRREEWDAPRSLEAELQLAWRQPRSSSEPAQLESASHINRPGEEQYRGERARKAPPNRRGENRALLRQSRSRTDSGQTIVVLNAEGDYGNSVICMDRVVPLCLGYTTGGQPAAAGTARATGSDARVSVPTATCAGNHGRGSVATPV